jgi:hypothetical protein
MRCPGSRIAAHRHPARSSPGRVDGAARAPPRSRLQPPVSIRTTRPITFHTTRATNTRTHRLSGFSAANTKAGSGVKRGSHKELTTPKRPYRAQKY